MFDFDSRQPGAALPAVPFSGRAVVQPDRRRLSKIIFDDALALMLLLPLALTGLVLLLLNPLLNPGKLVFRQTRMGQGCQPITVYKFRTMAPAGDHVAAPRRGPFDPPEVQRIGRFGALLRKTRLDELPQVINVLRGEMSLIGPRPDLYAHAEAYAAAIPGYAERHSAMPGITGYAQVTVGYVATAEDVARKVAADHAYIRRESLVLDLWITYRTIAVVLARKGC